MRLGTYYRTLLFNKIFNNKIPIKAIRTIVLDVGGFDGYWLSTQSAKVKMCVDIHPVKKFGGVIYVKADGLKLPFRDNIFDQVFAFDVLEHVADEKQFIKELYRVCKIGGVFIISTPHKNIRIFPPFLTGWVSKKWGHYRVRGYSEEEIKGIIRNAIPNGKYEIRIWHLREFFFRNFYFLLRFLWSINKSIAKHFVKIIVSADYRFLEGEKGHILVHITKMGERRR